MPWPALRRLVFVFLFEAPGSCHEVPALGTGIPRPPAAPRPTPHERPASPGERSLCVPVRSFSFFLLVSALGISRRGPGHDGEERKKKINKGSYPKGASQIPVALRAGMPPTHRVLWGAEKAPRPLSTARIPTSPVLQAHPLPPHFRIPQERVQQAWVQPSKAFGAAQHPTMMPREGETTPRGFCGILGWCRALLRRQQQGSANPMLPVIPAPKWVFLTGLPWAVLGHGSRLRPAGLCQGS